MVVFVPPITSPTADTKWVSGAAATVTWDASNAPEQISNGSSVVLKRAGKILATLAEGFDLKCGSVEVTVPAGLETAKDYCITLFGDSGNMSSEFEICSA
ncbi:unnamed protein product [Peniophora sp. CBMAI 1063]|nr:unnamed protein product [Peniophora sp. CBMAI 1063]